MNYTPAQRAEVLGTLKARITRAQEGYDTALSRMCDPTCQRNIFDLCLADAVRLNGELAVLKIALARMNQ